MSHPEREHSLQVEVARLTKRAENAEAAARILAKDVRAWSDKCDELRTERDALRAAESSVLERAAQECDSHAEYFAAQRIRALIPPAAAPETQRDIPCGGCGHPLWWHQWSSRERFCSKPLNERDFCRCKNYQEPAAAPADEKDLRSATANEKLPAQVCVPSAAIVAPARGPWRVGNHYGIHVYEGDVPIATFHREEDARRCVDAVNGAPTEGNR